MNKLIPFPPHKFALLGRNRMGTANKRIKNGIIALAVIVVAGLILGTGIGILYWGESTGWLQNGIQDLEGMGYVANIIIIIIFIPTSFPLIPGYALLPIVSGYLFKFWLGLGTTIIGSQLGFLAVYLVVNFLLRKRTEEVTIFFLFLMIIFGRLNFICSQFPKFVEKKGGKYVKAIMNEIITHRVKFAFLLRVLPVPIGLQNCVLSVAFYLSHSFFLQKINFLLFFPKKKRYHPFPCGCIK